MGHDGSKWTRLKVCWLFNTSFARTISALTSNERKWCSVQNRTSNNYNDKKNDINKIYMYIIYICVCECKRIIDGVWGGFNQLGPLASSACVRKDQYAATLRRFYRHKRHKGNGENGSVTDVFRPFFFSFFFLFFFVVFLSDCGARPGRNLHENAMRPIAVQTHWIVEVLFFFYNFWKSPITVANIRSKICRF